MTKLYDLRHAAAATHPHHFPAHFADFVLSKRRCKQAGAYDATAGTAHYMYKGKE